MEHHDVNALSVQFEPILGDQAANQEKILKLIEDAYAQDRTINLIVLPEMSVTGPISDRVESVKKAAEKVGGKTTAFFSAIAQKYKTDVYKRQAFQFHVELSSPLSKRLRTFQTEV